METAYNNKGLAAAVAAAMSLGTTAHAEGLAGPYIGGSIGQATVELNGHAQGQDFDVSDSDTGYKIFAGYMFNGYFGLEAGYVNFGEEKDHFGFDGGEGLFNVGVSGKANGHTFEVIGALPLGPVQVFAKAGVIYFNGKAKAQGTDGFTTVDSKEDFNSTDPTGGIGVLYNIGHFGIRAEGEIYDVSDASDLYLLSIGAQYTF
jgi:OOP family OmpA-OmpF porin